MTLEMVSIINAQTGLTDLSTLELFFMIKGNKYPKVKGKIVMLKILDYAKRCEMEWYEVMRLCIDEDTALQPIAILTHGELRVFELEEASLNSDRLRYC